VRLRRALPRHHRTGGSTLCDQRRHCPGRKPPFLAIKHPAPPYETAIQNRLAVENADGGLNARRGPGRVSPERKSDTSVSASGGTDDDDDDDDDGTDATRPTTVHNGSPALVCWRPAKPLASASARSAESGTRAAATAAPAPPRAIAAAASPSVRASLSWDCTLLGVKVSSTEVLRLLRASRIADLPRRKRQSYSDATLYIFYGESLMKYTGLC
jgi:hypothetical protein